METIGKDCKIRSRKSVVKKVVQGSNAQIPVSPEMIAKKAYELYEKRGCQQGFELQDWLEAKRILEAGG